ncbi:complex 1 lyr protein [Lojkania enalia]|uniref:LYR motif-containing protein 2 n=1 Tax=Lojkania enalia TaxID=147567 RepID=A0A9P4N1M3_9PLEO|nr:complex 1 lyr protein [Didymosphaeria enalia]
MHGYAAIATKASLRLRMRGKSPLGLDHFIQRQRALTLWREVLRSTAAISDVTTKNDMRQFARAEFEQHKNVTDLQHIRYLISTGKVQFDTMKGTLINSGVLNERAPR